MMGRIKVIININLCYELNVESVKEAKEKIVNIELPKEYVEDSFEIVKYLDKNDEEITEEH
jgi:hypothetical protein